jgi:hypothetical protein
LTGAEADELSAKHPMTLEFGVAASDVKIGEVLVGSSNYSVAGTNQTMTAEEVAERSEKQRRPNDRHVVTGHTVNKT